MMDITPSLAGYVLVIQHLEHASKPGRVRQVDVASTLDVSKPSVSKAVRRLVEEGLLAPEVRAGLRLTALGREAAARLDEERRCLTRAFESAGERDSLDSPCSRCPLARIP